MEFSYKMDVDVTPTSVRPGDSVSVTAKLADVVGEVKSVSVSVPYFGMMYSLKEKEENVFSFSTVVPWQAPSGQYELRIYATNTDGDRGPVTSTQLSIG